MIWKRWHNTFSFSYDWTIEGQASVRLRGVTKKISSIHPIALLPPTRTSRASCCPPYQPSMKKSFVTTQSCRRSLISWHRRSRNSVSRSAICSERSWFCETTKRSFKRWRQLYRSRYLSQMYSQLDFCSIRVEIQTIVICFVGRAGRGPAVFGAGEMVTRAGDPFSAAQRHQARTGIAEEWLPPGWDRTGTGTGKVLDIATEWSPEKYRPRKGQH